MDILGIDLAKLTFDVTLLTANQQHYHSFPNTPEGFSQLQSWLSEHGVNQVHACMAATNLYWEALATSLYAHGHIVSVVNPARITGSAQATMQRNQTGYPLGEARQCRDCLLLSDPLSRSLAAPQRGAPSLESLGAPPRGRAPDAPPAAAPLARSRRPAGESLAPGSPGGARQSAAGSRASDHGAPGGAS
jgi:hypothetical protein